MQGYLAAEISASAVEANLALIRKRIGPGRKLCAVVKADCLGHGVELLLPTISQAADCLAVATPPEAVQLRELGYEGSVLLFLSPCGYADAGRLREVLDELVRGRVTFTVASPDEVGPIHEAARRAGARVEVHVKVDTGMSRSGIIPARAPALVEQVRAADGLKLTGLYTHLATADNPDKTAALEQLRRFGRVVEAIPDRSELTIHAANSAATLSIVDSHLDMVRTGVAVVGYQLAYESLMDRPPLRPSLRLWGRLVQIKQVPAGRGVGYGLTCKLGRPSTLGLVPIGYADGYMRSLSNRTTMRVAGRDVPALGRVSMDQVVIDLTDVPEARVGQRVEIISPDPATPHSLENLARIADTIPQEIVCSLGHRVKRVLVD